MELAALQCLKYTTIDLYVMGENGVSSFSRLFFLLAGSQVSDHCPLG